MDYNNKAERETLAQAFGEHLEIAADKAKKDGLTIKDIIVGYQVVTDKKPMFGMIVSPESNFDDIAHFPDNSVECIQNFITERALGVSRKMIGDPQHIRDFLENMILESSKDEKWN